MCTIWTLFFFKQKTAYEMRISDWSSDVCSSDLPLDLAGHRLIGYGHRQRAMPLHFHRKGEEATVLPTGPLFANNGDIAVPLIVAGEIGRASCRERVGQYV